MENSFDLDELFPTIKVKGTPEEIGRQQGTILKERIHKTVEFYKDQFDRPEEEILRIASHFRKSTGEFSKNFYLEIEALSQAAEVNPLWIYALNGRTEILNLNPMECTSLAFRKQGIIGQNWDWDAEVEELGVVLDIEKEDGQRILTMTEPGMIGKIGMNSCSLAVCLNFMIIDDYIPHGVPLHILLRAILESRSLEEALATIKPHLAGKTGNILISTENGEAADIELAGEDFFFIPVEDLFVHTNHYLTNIKNSLELFPNTFGRYDRAKKLLGGVNHASVEAMKQILKDSDNEQSPICRKRFSHPLLTDDTSITVCSIIMDLKNLEFHITRGNPFDNPFSVHSLADHPRNG